MARDIIKLITLCGVVALLASSAAAEPVKGPRSGAAKTQTSPLSEFELGKYQYCGSDLDCVAVNNGCCDCANGGADVAINKERLGEFNARFNCSTVMCTARAKVPPCGSGVVSCVNHKCRYVEAADASM